MYGKILLQKKIVKDNSEKEKKREERERVKPFSTRFI